MKKVAKTTKPDYVLNVGDNFYPGGIGLPGTCGKAGNQPTNDAAGHAQWTAVWDDVYFGNDSALTGKPWLSVLGNHDYGGRGFLTGWDQQIFTTWDREDWVMPGQYWSRKVQYADFAVEYFFMESNIIDARDAGDKHHYICQGSGECFGINAGNCHNMFQDAYTKSIEMLEKGLKASTAEFHIIVTHYPGPDITSDAQIKALHDKYSIDLVFTGHQHEQKIGQDGGMNYIISGGGGGVTTDGSESHDGHDGAYGFVDFAINRTALTIKMYTWGGPDGYEIVQQTMTIPSHKTKKKEASQPEIEVSRADITV
jgi:predicted phosphodiesterase